MKACVLAAVESDPAKVADGIAGVPGVLDAFPVLGRREVVVRAEVRNMSHLAHLLDRISASKGVIVSETLLEIPQVAQP